MTTGVYQRPNGRWRASYEVAVAGKRRQKTGTFATKRQAVTWRNQQLADINTRGIVDGAMPFENWCERWLESALFAGRAPSTIDAARRTLALYVGHLATMRVGDLRTVDIDIVLADMAGGVSERTGRPLTAGTINRFRILLHKIFEDACRKGLIAHNPVTHADRRPSATPAPVAWNLEQLDSFLAWLTTAGKHGEPHHHHAPLHLLAWTGLRWGELRDLTWSNVDLDAAALTVVSAFDTTSETSRAPKSLAGVRTVAVDPATVAVLTAHRAAQQRKRLQVGAWAGGDLVFVGPDTRRLSDGGLRQAFRRLQARYVSATGVDLPQIPLKGLRSTHATIYSTVATPRDVAARLGHADGGVTALKHYVAPGDVAAAHRVLAAIRDAV